MRDSIYIPTATVAPHKKQEHIEKQVTASINWIRNVKDERDAKWNAESILREYHRNELKRMSFFERLFVLFYL